MTGDLFGTEVAIVARPAPAPLSDPDRCECGGAFVFDPALEGETCGGLHRIGWLHCDRCPATCVSKRGRSADVWALNSSGRSVDAGGVRVRGDGDGMAEVMARVARVPELEALARAAARGEDVREMALAIVGAA